VKHYPAPTCGGNISQLSPHFTPTSLPPDLVILDGVPIVSQCRRSHESSDARSETRNIVKRSWCSIVIIRSMELHRITNSINRTRNWSSFRSKRFLKVLETIYITLHTIEYHHLRLSVKRWSTWRQCSLLGDVVAIKLMPDRFGMRGHWTFSCLCELQGVTAVWQSGKRLPLSRTRSCRTLHCQCRSLRRFEWLTISLSREVLGRLRNRKVEDRL
jgi:hypothetical protein